MVTLTLKGPDDVNIEYKPTFSNGGLNKVVAQTGKKWFHGWLAVALFIASIAVFPAPSRAAGENLLGNPGFESGDVGWEKWGSPVVTASEKHGGDKSLQVKRNTGEPRRLWRCSKAKPIVSVYGSNSPEQE